MSLIFFFIVIYFGVILKVNLCLEKSFLICLPDIHLCFLILFLKWFDRGFQEIWNSGIVGISETRTWKVA